MDNMLIALYFAKIVLQFAHLVQALPRTNAKVVFKTIIYKIFLVKVVATYIIMLIKIQINV